jgi:hypothetical protein
LLGLLLWGVADVVIEVVEELMAAVVGADRVGAIPDLIDPAVGLDDPAGAQAVWTPSGGLMPKASR